MTKKKPPEAQVPEQHDPYKLRSLEQILALFDGGDFLAEVMDGHRKLQIELLEHSAEHGSKGCDGTMTIKISYALGKSGDVSMGAKAEFKGPKAPPSSATAYINDKGELTLYSPLLARMHQPVRDVTPHDPETGEVRDVD
ncbi:MAG: hypothetical protein EP318_15575 [Rhodobacteraceae bacterium]|nr:MAG: hypothetical protein EP318_15575 [Paracoccaceae bacterium]